MQGNIPNGLWEKSVAGKWIVRHSLFLYTTNEPESKGT